MPVQEFIHRSVFEKGIEEQINKCYSKFMIKILKFTLSFCILISAFCIHSSAQEIPKEEEALLIAKKAQGDGFYGAALGLYEQFLNNYPHSFKVPEVNLYIGQCYLFQKRFQVALIKFNELLKEPGFGSIKDASLYWIAEAYFQRNDYQQASHYYQRVIKDFPDSKYLIPAYYSLGWCRYHRQDYSCALRHFRKVVEESEDVNLSGDASFKIMDCLYYLKDYTKLKSFIKSYLKTHPEDEEQIGSVLFYLAEANYYLGRYKEAQDTYNQTIKIASNKRIRDLSRLGLGWSYIKLEKYKESEKIFEQLKEEKLDNKNLQTLLLARGILSNQRQRFEDGLEIYSDLLNTSSSPDVLIQAYLGKAESLCRLSRYKEAIEIYKEASKKLDLRGLDLKSIDKLHYNWAWVYLKDGQFKKAISEFKKVASRSNDKIVKIASLCLTADTYQDTALYQKAIKSYRRILKDYPDSLYSDYLQYQLGVSFLKLSKYDEAISIFMSLLENFPQSKLWDEVTYALGLTYFRKEDYIQSVELLGDFSDGFKDSPLRSQGMYLWASAFYNQGRFTDAIEVFEKIIKLYPRDLDLVERVEYEIADCFYRTGEEEKALQNFKALRSKYPDSKFTQEVLWWLGAYYYRKGETELARRYFEAIVQDFPESKLAADANYALGTTYEEEKNYKKAIEKFKMVINLGESDLAGQAILAISDIYVRTGQIQQALHTYNQAERDFPHLADLLYPKIADIYKDQGDYDKAIAFYRQALQASSINQMRVLQFKIAECLQEQRRLKEAIEEYLKVTYGYSQDKSLVAKALIRVGQIYEDKERFTEARQVYRKVLSMEVQEAKYAQERIQEIDFNSRRKEF